MKQGKKLTRNQKILVNKVGLVHTDWLCHFEDEQYLHLVKKNKIPAEFKILDKAKKKALVPTKANQGNQNNS